jgi:hypothetical protein
LSGGQYSRDMENGQKGICAKRLTTT